MSLAEGIVGWAFMLSKVAVGSEHWSARDCVSLTGLACKGLCVPGRSVVDVGGASGEVLELMNSEHVELVLHVELLLPLRQR